MHARVHVKGAVKQCAAAAAAAVSPLWGNPPMVVALMYHRVNSYRSNELSVEPEVFRGQVAWLAGSGYRNLRLADVESGLLGSLGAGDRHVIFSFDDGYEDNYTDAAPILAEYGYTAIFYIPTLFPGTDRMVPRDVRESNRIEENRRMTWEQVRDLSRQNMEIGSHTRSHEILTHLGEEQARSEIFDSRDELQDRISAPVTSFCYPGGHYGREHVELAKEAGYRSACTATPGWPNVGTDLFELPRLAVNRSDSLLVFKQKLQGRLQWLPGIR